MFRVGGSGPPCERVVLRGPCLCLIRDSKGSAHALRARDRKGRDDLVLLPPCECVGGTGNNRVACRSLGRGSSRVRNAEGVHPASRHHMTGDARC